MSRIREWISSHSMETFAWHGIEIFSDYIDIRSLIQGERLHEFPMTFDDFFSSERLRDTESHAAPVIRFQ